MRIFYEKNILHVYGYMRELELAWMRKVKKWGGGHFHL
jgi:hypothetical protein